MASRRRRRKGIGKVLTSVERKVRRIEKRPGAKRLKNNVVTAEKILPRTIVTKKIATDAVTSNEVDFGVTVISETQPTTVKEGTIWVDPTDGATQVYSTDSSSFIPVTDATAQSISAGKNKTYVQANEPTGGTYLTGDSWIDTDDGNKLYIWSGTAWVDRQDADIAFAQATADGKNAIYRQTTAPTGGTYTSGDLWFDTDDNNKIYRFDGTNWNTAVQLGGNALANVNANTITAGTIDASVITVSNINAGNITTGKIDTGLITVSTNPTATGNTARVEVTSLGFFAYDGTVATVSITNAGTAVFSGTVNANGGNFTGYVTGGTMRFGANVSGTDDGIYINANNYWYDTGTFKVGDSTSYISYSGGTLTVVGTLAVGSTIAGTSASTVVSNAAEGATALQAGNGVAKDGNDFITTINTSSGIKIGTNPTAAGNTARVEINSNGFFAFNGSVETVSISSSGSASFTGTVNANAGNFTGYVTAGNMRIGANVDGSSEGIYVNSNNYWYDTGAFKLGDGTNFVSFSGGTLTVTGTISASSVISANVSGDRIVGGTITGINIIQTGTASSKAELTNNSITGQSTRAGLKITGINGNISGWVSSYAADDSLEIASNYLNNYIDFVRSANQINISASGGFIINSTAGTGSVSSSGALTLAGSSSAASLYIASSGNVMTGSTTFNSAITANGTLTMGANIVMGGNLISGVNEVQAQDGSVSDPSFTFTNNLNSGMYNDGDVNITRQGVLQWYSSGTGIVVPNGYRSVNPNANVTYVLGTTSLRWSSGYVAGGLISSSDSRTKNSIADSDLGLDFIEKLRPVKYKVNQGSVEFVFDEERGKDAVDENGDPVVIRHPGVRPHYGFIAQEVKGVIDQLGVDFAGWTQDELDNPNSYQSLRYDEFIAPAIKAIQELLARVKQIESKI